MGKSKLELHQTMSLSLFSFELNHRILNVNEDKYYCDGKVN